MSRTKDPNWQRMYQGWPDAQPPKHDGSIRGRYILYALFEAKEALKGYHIEEQELYEENQCRSRADLPEKFMPKNQECLATALTIFVDIMEGRGSHVVPDSWL